MVSKNNNHPVASGKVGEQAAYHNLVGLLLTSIMAVYIGFGFGMMPNNADWRSTQVLIAGVALLVYWYASRYMRNPRLVTIAKYAALATIVLGITLLSLIDMLSGRLQPGAHHHIHDGALQVEEAAHFFLAGQNPYVMDYDQTALADWGFNFRGVTTHPALYHYIYLPLSFMLTAPFLALSEWAFGWFDIRLIFGAFWAGSLALCFYVTKKETRRMLLLITIGLSLLSLPFFIEGRNDVVLIAALLGIVYLLQNEKIILAAVVLGLACSFKQTMWFAAPFFFVYIGGEGNLRERLARLIWPLVAFIVPFGGLVLPWILADPAAFFEDTFAYLSGRILTSYPMSGIGFAELVYAVGAVESVSDYFPFTIYQLAAGLPVFAIGLWRQYKTNTLRNTLWHYTLLLFTFAYFARTFNDSYLGFLIVVIACAVLIDEPDRPIQKDSAGMPDMGLLVFSLLMGQQVLLTPWPTVVTLLLLLHSLAALLFLSRLSTSRRWMIWFSLIAITVIPMLLGPILLLPDTPQPVDAVQATSQQVLQLQNPYQAAPADLTAWPAILLLNAPLQWALTAMTGWYDFRLLTGILMFVSAALGLTIFQNNTQRVVFLLGLVLNPVLVFHVAGGDVSYVILTILLLVILLLRSGRNYAAAFMLATACSAHWIGWALVPFAALYVWDKADLKRVIPIFLLGLALWLGFFLITDLSGTLPYLFFSLADSSKFPHGLAGILGINQVWAGILQGMVGVGLAYMLIRWARYELSLANMIAMSAFTGLAVLLVGHTIHPVVGGLLIIWGGIGLMLTQNATKVEPAIQAG